MGGREISAGDAKGKRGLQRTAPVGIVGTLCEEIAMLTSILILTFAAANPTGQARARDAGSVSTIGQPTNTYGHAKASERAICLRNKVSKQNECRTRAEWTRVAAQMRPER
jgi:hypothetical protein